MTHETQIHIPAPSDTIRTVVMPPLDAPVQELPAEATQIKPVDPEQARAVEKVFGSPSEEDKAAARAFGLWMGTGLLRDLAIDMFSKPADEDDEPDRKKATGEPE
jgi:hypothetical protein